MSKSNVNLLGFGDLINEFGKVSRDLHNGSYAYEAGYLQSMVVGMFSRLPLKEKALYHRQVRETIDRLTQKS